MELNNFNIKYDITNTPNMYCMIAMIFQLASLITDLIHYAQYSNDGIGFVQLEVITTLFEMISESLMTMLILMLANGWMTYDLKNEDESEDIYIPIAIVVFMLHIMIGMLTYVDQNAYHKYHDFNGW